MFWEETEENKRRRLRLEDSDFDISGFSGPFKKLVELYTLDKSLRN